MVQDTFFDRTQYLELLEKRVRALKDGYRQNLAVIGNDQAGKTSIICDFLKKFQDNRFIPVYLEVRPEPFASFSRRFIAVLLYSFLQNSEMPLKEDIDFLVNKASGFIPRSVEKIRYILAQLNKNRKDPLFCELLSLCEAIYQETGKFCVVIFDEFTNLEALGIKKPYAEWSKLLIQQKNTLYIIVSSRQYKARAILAKDLSLLFGNFEVMTVEPFDIKTAEQFLEHTLAGYCLDRPLKDFLVHFTGGYPFYLQVICDALSKFDQSYLTYVMEDLLFSPQGSLHQKFSTRLKQFQDAAHSQDLLAILYCVASGHNKIRDIAHLSRKTRKEIDARINYLLELDTISRSADFLKISDRVFGFWLKFVHQEQLQSLTFDAKNQKAMFRQKIEAMVQEFVQQAKRPVSERMMELLRLFEDDQVQIERKKVRLSHFREVKSLELNARALREGLICRSQESLWIIAFTSGLLNEEDIAAFAKECKKYRHKLQKKIIVTLNDIDANSRLRALEEKITTWDINNINQLFDLYSKPRVIA